MLPLGDKICDLSIHMHKEGSLKI